MTQFDQNAVDNWPINDEPVSREEDMKRNHIEQPELDDAVKERTERKIVGGDVLQEFETGAHRDTCEGKGDMSLLPWEALERISIHYQLGAKKYGRNNWKKGMPSERYVDSAVRHLYKALKGFRDEDHLAAAAWNVMAAIWNDENGMGIESNEKA